VSRSRGDPARVVEAHRQARRSLAVAASFTAAAPLAALTPAATGQWVGLHLFLVGGLLSAISGATQLLAVTWSSSPAPARALTTSQRWILATGAAAVAAGRELSAPWLVTSGAAAVGVALVLLGACLVIIRAGAVTDRFIPAIDTYLLAVTAGIAGTVAAAALANGWGDLGWVPLRSAHLTVNLYGLVGLVVAGTLPYFVATQARTKMSARATPGRLRLLAGVLLGATAVASGGHLASRPGVAAAGLLGYAAGLLALPLLLPAPTRRQLTWGGPRLLQLAAGWAWWVITTILMAATVGRGWSGQGAVLRAMAIGGFAQILVASLAYFGPVLRGGGHRRLTAGFAVTRSWPGLVAANVAAVSVLVGPALLTAVALLAWAADSASRAVRLVRPASRAT
jgi:hypothetical protein